MPAVATLRYLTSLLLVTVWAHSALGQERPQRPVIVAPIPQLIRRPAHLFNLGGKTLRFLPRKEGGYRVQTLSVADLVPTPNPLAWGDVMTGRGKQTLPFAFPFGGKGWTELFVSLNGSLSFGRSEAENRAERAPWAAGGMRSVAGALDERSAAGQEALIAVLWAMNEAAKDTWSISTKADKDRFIVTWEVQRSAVGHAVEGRSRFQARLYRDGMIEMAYEQITRQDGIVGLFPGTAPPGTLLDHVACSPDASGPGAEVEAIDVFDVGTALKFLFTLRHEVPLRLEHGQLSFGVTIDDSGVKQQWSVSIAESLSSYADVDADPRTLGYRIDGRTMALFLSKTRLVHPNAWRWAASLSREQNGKSETTEIVPVKTPRPIQQPRSFASEPRLKQARKSSAGNLFEVFHYPWVAKESRELLKSLYKRLPAEDDFAVVFTDFRIDDLFAQGPSTGALNVPIKGIGQGEDSPQSTREAGYPLLQVTPATVWIGAPFFSEQGPDEFGMAYTHYARGVVWLAHELSHRWGMELRFHNPQTGNEEPLSDSSSHWLLDLFAPALIPDTASFPADPPGSVSIMSEGGGRTWRANPDGTYQTRRHPWWRNPGFSALDLYVMGLIPPEQVPDTFLMQDVRPIAGGKPTGDGWSSPVTATKVAVRMQDILSAMGPRVPDTAHAQKEFRLGIYLVPAPGKKAAPAMLDRANHVALALADFFETATGHRMKIVIAPSAR